MNILYRNKIRLFLPLLCVASNVYSIGTNVVVGYNVPVVCSINNLPNTVNLSVLATERGTYTTNFQISCNTSDYVNLTLNSLNQFDGSPRLVSLSNHYLKYQVMVNNIVYTMGQSNHIVPNTNNNLILNIDKPTYTGKYQDSLVFTISY